MTVERARLAREQADHFALGNAAKRKELLPRVEITQAVTAAFGIVRERLCGLPDRLAGPLARLTDPSAVRRCLEDAVNGALLELSEERVVASTVDAADAA